MRALNLFFLLSATSGLPQSLRDKFSLLWLGEISGNSLVDVIAGNNITITGKDFATDYIPSTSAATFALPDVAELKTDDEDGLWYNGAGTAKQVPASYLAGNDYTRTLVKYDYSSPYNIRWIGLLKDDAVITSDEWNQLHSYFWLQPFWSGTLNLYGVTKDNRGLAADPYQDWISKVIENGYTEPSSAVKISIKKLLNDLREYGVYSGLDRFWCFMLNDANLVSTTATISMAKPEATKLTFPVAPTYTTSGFKGNGTSQYANTNFDIATGVNYTQNSASRFFYRYVDATNGQYYEGAGTNNVFIASNASSLHRINGASQAVSTAVRGTGYAAIDRADSSNFSIYNETTKFDRSAASATITTNNVVISNGPFGFGDAGISFYGVGRHFTQTEHANIRTALIAHKTRLGL